MSAVGSGRIGLIKTLKQAFALLLGNGLSFIRYAQHGMPFLSFLNHLNRSVRLIVTNCIVQQNRNQLFQLNLISLQLKEKANPFKILFSRKKEKDYTIFKKHLNFV